MANNTIKINANSPGAYRKLVEFMKENIIVHHTYQPKQERAYRIIIKYLHHFVDLRILKKNKKPADTKLEI